MRLVTDFDGVYTDPRGEAEAVGQRQQERLTEALGSANSATAILEEVRSEVRAQPGDHGWVSAGKLACFSDEDPYIFHNAVAAALYQNHSDKIGPLIENGFETHDDFSAACFYEGTEAWRKANPTHLLDEAISAVKKLIEAGHEIVVVSNSSTDRVKLILSDLGVQEGEGFLLRGGARKFVLTPEEPSPHEEEMQFGTRMVNLQRNHYLEILEELQPDAVIGDVLSLDLALPAALRNTSEWASSLRLFLKKNPYTPDWSIEAARATDMSVVESVTEMVEELGL